MLMVDILGKDSWWMKMGEESGTHFVDLHHIDLHPHVDEREVLTDRMMRKGFLHSSASRTWCQVFSTHRTPARHIYLAGRRTVVGMGKTWEDTHIQ